MLSTTLITSAFQAFLKSTSDMIFVKDTHLVYVTASLPFAKMAGKNSVEDIVGRTDFEIFEDAELAKRYRADDRKLLTGGVDLVDYIEPLAGGRNLNRYSTTSKYILRDEEGRACGILGVSRDITREYASRLRYQQELSYLFELPADTYAALFMDIDDWRIIRHQRNSVGECTIPLCDTMEDFRACALDCIVDKENSAVGFYRELSKASMQKLCENGTRSHALEYPRRMPGGEEVWVHVDIHFILDPESGHHCAIWTMRDIDSAVKEMLSLRRAAEFDEMTGILSRTFTFKTIEDILGKTPEERHALFMLDVDNFKNLNDTLGHQSGDAFLADLARTLKGCFRESDVVGRIGGDEFFVMMKSIQDRRGVADKAEKLLEAIHSLCRRYAADLSVSMGAALYPADGIDLPSLYAKADEALYDAKKKGKNRYCFADESK